MEAPATPPGKVKITPELIEEWTHDAGVLLDANCSKAEAVRDLRVRGCTPKLAQQIVTKARGPVRTAHRGLGIRALALGGGIAGLGWLLSGPLGRHSLRAMELMAVGGVIAAVGAFKMLTGNAFDVDRLNILDDD